MSAGTVVGYRVREQLAALSAQTDAVGRTSSVIGSATLAASGDGLSVPAAGTGSIRGRSRGSGCRGGRRRWSRSSGPPRSSTATFVLSSPVDVPAEALDGATVDVTLVGDLTIHGVTKSVSIPAQAQLTADGQVNVLGSMTFPFSDFGMTPPNIGGFVSVEDDATLEFVLILAR
ncbi:MAG: YceI family protein [Chloroflexi bacterium]|nr:YceI family protein [Chloroflexota bacterium]